MPIPAHLEETTDFAAVGGRGRVEGVLATGEEVEYASLGSIEDVSMSPSTRPGGGGKRKDGLLLLTDRRVLVICKPGAFRKDPKPISIGYESIANAGPNRDVPTAVSIASDDGPVLFVHHLIFPPPAGDMTAAIWATEIRERAGIGRGAEA